MAELFPFRAYRYNPNEVGDIVNVVTQPYDKITSEMWRDYLRRHPQNIVRVIKNRNYEDAGYYLKEWIRTGILRQDAEAAFYPYQQTFQVEGEELSRIGFVGLISLQDADLKVKGHERVLDAPLQDRLNLIRSTESNEGLIFTIYSDPSLRVDQLLSEFTAQAPPVVEVEESNQVRHRIWKLSDEDVQREITAALKDAVLYIADGHHRFQTSLTFCRECVEKGWSPAAVESFDKRMIALFNMNSPGLRILPTHRVVRNLPDFDRETLLSRLRTHFEVESLVGLPELELAMQDSSSGTYMGLVVQPNDCYMLRLKDSSREAQDFMPELTGPARALDVNILHEGILRPILGVGPEELASQKSVDYVRESRDVVHRVSQGEFQAGFLLNPTTLDQVREISERGEQMPQKSTDFYPKLLTGLVLMKMEIDKGKALD